MKSFFFGEHNSRNNDYYWIASQVTYGRKNIRKTTYFSCIPISKARAISYVKYGGNVFANSQAAARRLAVSVGNGANPVGPEKHGGVDSFGIIMHIIIGRTYFLLVKSIFKNKK